jgi:hypothetical protein
LLRAKSWGVIFFSFVQSVKGLQNCREQMWGDEWPKPL